MGSLACVVSLTGCGRQPPIVAAPPQPNVDLDKSDESLALLIDKGIANAFFLGTSGEVANWHRTLQVGYTNAFGDAFRLVSNKPDLVLVLRRAELVLARAAVDQHGWTVAVRAQLTYQARLTDAAGRIVRRSSGTVGAKQAVTGRSMVAHNMGEAVATMYEKIATDVFASAKPTDRPATT